jgi:hypothetical protein
MFAAKFLRATIGFERESQSRSRNRAIRRVHNDATMFKQRVDCSPL